MEDDQGNTPHVHFELYYPLTYIPAHTYMGFWKNVTNTLYLVSKSIAM